MNVNAVRHLTVPITEILRPAIAGGAEKIALPVANFTPWANFQYVLGVPAGSDGGYSISKLQVLDTIIGNLVGYKDNATLRQVPDDIGGLDDASMDRLIEQLASRLRDLSTSAKGGTASSLGQSFGLAVSQTGATLNILV